MRISNSFSEGEVQLLEFIFQTLLRGGTPTMAARHKEFASVYRKVISMKQRIEKQKTEKGLKSSVGTIQAPSEVSEDEAVTDGDEREQQAS